MVGRKAPLRGSRRAIHFYLSRKCARRENAYNTKLVNPKEIKSYWDFLDPKWKGKIVAYDVSRVSTIAHSLRFLYNHPDLGPEFIKRFFGEMDITYSRDERQMIDWLG